MSFTAQDVKALRDSSGAGMMDCKKALQENDGDIEAAKRGFARRVSPPAPSVRTATRRRASSAS